MARWALAAAAALAACALAPAQAQVDCRELGRQIAASGRNARESGEARRYARAAAAQQAEIDRTVSYGLSIGCWRQGFFSNPPAVCGQIDERVYRMRANLAQLSARATPAPGIGGVDRETLQLEYDAWCRGARETQRTARGDPFSGPPPGLRREPIEALPPEDLPPDEPDQDWDDDASAQPPAAQPSDGQERAGARAICVRSCDGGYFPLTVRARAGKMTDLQELCTALCPNTEARLYTLPAGGAVSEAIDRDGKPYAQHPNAFLFRKKYDAACACKPAGKNWGQVLNDAEKIIDKETGGADKTVTPREAEALSKPEAPAAAPARRNARNPTDPASGTAAKPSSDAAAKPAPGKPEPPAARPPSADATTPSPGTEAPAPPQGETKDVIGPDGVRRKVRIVGPKT